MNRLFTDTLAYPYRRYTRPSQLQQTSLPDFDHADKRKTVSQLIAMFDPRTGLRFPNQETFREVYGSPQDETQFSEGCEGFDSMGGLTTCYKPFEDLHDLNFEHNRISQPSVNFVNSLAATTSRPLQDTHTSDLPYISINPARKHLREETSSEDNALWENQKYQMEYDPDFPVAKRIKLDYPAIERIDNSEPQKGLLKMKVLPSTKIFEKGISTMAVIAAGAFKAVSIPAKVLKKASSPRRFYVIRKRL